MGWNINRLWYMKNEYLLSFICLSFFIKVIHPKVENECNKDKANFECYVFYVNLHYPNQFICSKKSYLSYIHILHEVSYMYICTSNNNHFVGAKEGIKWNSSTLYLLLYMLQFFVRCLQSQIIKLRKKWIW